MSLFTDWGFTRDSWKGQRGEYWLLAQIILLMGFFGLPRYQPAALEQIPAAAINSARGIAVLLVGVATLFLAKGLVDLGKNLTPLPYPRESGELVQTGVYGLVRHSLYSGLILGALGYALWHFSLTHLGGAIALFLVLNAKASLEESWLMERYPHYSDYRQRVKKLIPWVF
ncbi:isoprenylcysteine carboxylmethyltransferase family protein [Pseudanabaena sp. FACHB-2040]|uniref:methyltransferase family protein n=1 Tax=Pseudanabaena sp. FACHB-2040 TaxID=2692859 RepID=UPI0016838DD1|nr:isoprenylcysteine carboxylmethyltransferase family protein [Pseudanabaena sp. FACHB-2040]MBD2258991.1 isoprenylcysteine carboxylmethyltransferase family protein [Pseudanabaena sp. FACHB-2040]